MSHEYVAVLKAQRSSAPPRLLEQMVFAGESSEKNVSACLAP